MLSHIKTWVFDLDNTLYPKDVALYRKINDRITEFMVAEIGMSPDEADIARRRMFKAHGTTLLGLMKEYNIAPRSFLDFVHNIKCDEIVSSPAMERALNDLPGRKIIFTNSIGSYAERILDRIGIRNHFEGIQDLYASSYLPKPAPSAYRDLITRFGIEPQTTAMIDDMARNLSPAAELGMTTIWIKGGPFPDDVGHTSNIHHAVEDLVTWLRSGTLNSGTHQQD